MSIFETKSVCENVKFYSHHIDPQVPNVSGVLSLANGHTTSSLVPDQAYSLTAVSSTDPSANNHLQLVGQAGGPSPAVLAMDVAPDGTVNFPVALQVNGTPIGGGGGSSAQSKQAIASVASPPAPSTNNTTVYTFNLTGCTGNYYQFTIDSISATVNTPGLGCAYDFFISDTLNGAYNAAEGCIKYNTGVITNGNSFGSGPRTFIYKAATPPAALYLNIIQTNATQVGTLSNLAFNCEILSQTVSVV